MLPTFLFLMVWKCISQTLSTVSSFSNVTKPNPRCLLVCWSISITASSTLPANHCHKLPPFIWTTNPDRHIVSNLDVFEFDDFPLFQPFFRGVTSCWKYFPKFCTISLHFVDLTHVGRRLRRIPTKIKPLQSPDETEPLHPQPL